VVVLPVDVFNSFHKETHAVAVHLRVIPVDAVVLRDMVVMNQEKRLDQYRPLHPDADRQDEKQTACKSELGHIGAKTNSINQNPGARRMIRCALLPLSNNASIVKPCSNYPTGPQHL
jgi:hypothetical protein